MLEEEAARTICIACMKKQEEAARRGCCRRRSRQSEEGSPPQPGDHPSPICSGTGNTSLRSARRVAPLTEPRPWLRHARHAWCLALFSVVCLLPLANSALRLLFLRQQQQHGHHPEQYLDQNSNNMDHLGGLNHHHHHLANGHNLHPGAALPQPGPPHQGQSLAVKRTAKRKG